MLASTPSTLPYSCSRRRGGLLADPGDAGDVVGGVALEPDQVGNRLRGHAPALDHRLAVVDLGLADALGRRHHPDPVADQLVDVAVAGDDHHRDPAPLGLRREGGDHVVGLPALDPDVGEAKRLGERRQVRPLLLEQVGPRLALRLVLGVDLLAARHARVPGDDDRRRPVLGERFDHHRGEAVDRVRRPPVGGRHRLGQGEEGAVGEAVAVDQEELARLLHLVRLLAVLGRHAADHRKRPDEATRGGPGAPLSQAIYPHHPVGA